MHWCDGALAAESRMPFDLGDRGLLLGDGVFDTSLVLRGRMVWRQAHLRRLATACETLGFALNEREAERAIDALVPGVARGALRLTVTRGSGPRGLAPPRPARPRLFASVAPLPPLGFAPVALQGAASRRNETAPTAQLKTLNYLDAVLASGEAKQAGFDDALFLNTRGHVACAAVGNIVALSGRSLLTPPLADGVLDGIARATLLRLAPDLGLEPVERSLLPGDLERADAVFVTNSLRLLAPVARINQVERTNAPNLVHLVTEAICGSVAEDCGSDPRADA